MVKNSIMFDFDKSNMTKNGKKRFSTTFGAFINYNDFRIFSNHFFIAATQ